MNEDITLSPYGKFNYRESRNLESPTSSEIGTPRTNAYGIKSIASLDDDVAIDISRRPTVS